VSDLTAEFSNGLLTQRRFASLADVIDHLQDHYGDGVTVAAFFRAKKTNDEAPVESPTEFLYLNSISFLLERGELQSFPSPVLVEGEIARLSDRSDLDQYDFANLVFFCSRSLDPSDAEDVATLLISFFLACDVDANQVEGAVRRLVRRTAGTPHNLPGIAAAISARFEVMAPYYLSAGPDATGDYQLIDRASDPLTTRLLAHQSIRIDAADSLRAGQSYSGRVTWKDENFYYKVVPVIYLSADNGRQFRFDVEAERITKVRPRMNLKRHAAIVLISRQPIGTFCYAYAKELVEVYAGAPSHATKTMVMQLVAELRAKAQLDLLEAPFRGATAQSSRIRAFAQAVCSALIQVTSAHSATVRLFAPFSQTLDVAASAFCDSLPPASATTSPIAVDPEVSLNAFVFRKVKPGETVYIRNVRDPLPERLVQGGLKRLMTCRVETMSEICIPIVKTGLTIGVVNVEASTDYAFDRDVGFIEWIVRQLGEYIDVVSRSSDAGWVPRLSFMHFAAHRMEQLERALKEHAEVLANIKAAERRISPDYIDPDEQEEISTDDLMARVNEFIGPSSDTSVKGLEITGQMPRRLPPRVAHSLEVILENLLQNAQNHDNMEFPVKMEFEGEGEDASLPGSNLTISYTPEGKDLSQEDADGVSIAPRWDPIDQTYHLGAFLAGVHVRLLGGMMWVNQEKVRGGGVPFRYVVQIPLARSEIQEGE